MEIHLIFSLMKHEGKMNHHSLNLSVMFHHIRFLSLTLSAVSHSVHMLTREAAKSTTFDVLVLNTVIFPNSGTTGFHDNQTSNDNIQSDRQEGDKIELLSCFLDIYYVKSWRSLEGVWPKGPVH